jgi:hypothetical protein
LFTFLMSRLLVMLDRLSTISTYLDLGAMGGRLGAPGRAASGSQKPCLVFRKRSGSEPRRRGRPDRALPERNKWGMGLGAAGNFWRAA